MIVQLRGGGAVLNDEGAVGVRNVQTGGGQQLSEQGVELVWILVGPQRKARGAPNEFKRLRKCLDNVHAVEAIPWAGKAGQFISLLDGGEFFVVHRGVAYCMAAGFDKW